MRNYTKIFLSICFLVFIISERGFSIPTSCSKLEGNWTLMKKPAKTGSYRKRFFCLKLNEPKSLQWFEEKKGKFTYKGEEKISNIENITTRLQQKGTTSKKVVYIDLRLKKKSRGRKSLVLHECSKKNCSKQTELPNFVKKIENLIQKEDDDITSQSCLNPKKSWTFRKGLLGLTSLIITEQEIIWCQKNKNKSFLKFEEIKSIKVKQFKSLPTDKIGKIKLVFSLKSGKEKTLKQCSTKNTPCSKVSEINELAQFLKKKLGEDSENSQQRPLETSKPLGNQKIERCSKLEGAIERSKEALSPKIRPISDLCYHNYGYKKDEILKVKKARHFIADLLTYQVSSKEKPTLDIREVFRLHKEIVIELIKNKSLGKRAFAEIAQLDQSLTKYITRKKNELKNMSTKEALDKVISAVQNLRVEKSKESKVKINEFLNKILSSFKKDWEQIKKDPLLSLLMFSQTIKSNQQTEVILNALKKSKSKTEEDSFYEKAFLSQKGSDKERIDTLYKALSLAMNKFADVLPFDLAIALAINTIVKENPNESSVQKKLSAFIKKLMGTYYGLMNLSEKKSLVGSILRNTIPDRTNPSFIYADQFHNYLASIINGSGTFIQKLVQKFSDKIVPKVDRRSYSSQSQYNEKRIEKFCTIRSLESAKSGLAKNPDFDTIAQFEHLGKHSGWQIAKRTRGENESELRNYCASYIGRASVGVAFQAELQKRKGEPTKKVAIKILRYRAKEKFEREKIKVLYASCLAAANSSEESKCQSFLKKNNKKLEQCNKEGKKNCLNANLLLGELKEKPFSNSLAKFLLAWMEEIEGEFNLGGKDGEIANLKLAHQEYFSIGTKSGTNLRYGAIGPVDYVKNFKGDREYMAMHLADGSELSDIVEKQYRPANESSKDIVGFIKEFNKITKNHYNLKTNSLQEIRESKRKLKILVYSQIYLVNELIRMWVQKSFFHKHYGIFHADLHMGNMFINIKVNEISKLLGQKKEITYNSIKDFARKSPSSLKDSALLSLTMIDFGAWGRIKRDTSRGLLNLTAASVLGTFKGFQEAMDLIKSGFPQTTYGQSLLRDWDKNKTNPQLKKSIESLMKQEDLGIQERLQKILFEVFMMKYQAIPPESIISFFNGFIALTNSTRDFEKQIQLMKLKGLDLDKHSLWAVNGKNSFSDRLQQLVTTDSPQNIVNEKELLSRWNSSYRYLTPENTKEAKKIIWSIIWKTVGTLRPSRVAMKGKKALVLKAKKSQKLKSFKNKLELKIISSKRKKYSATPKERFNDKKLEKIKKRILTISNMCKKSQGKPTYEFTNETYGGGKIFVFGEERLFWCHGKPGPKTKADNHNSIPYNIMKANEIKIEGTTITIPLETAQNSFAKTNQKGFDNSYCSGWDQVKPERGPWEKNGLLCYENCDGLHKVKYKKALQKIYMSKKNQCSPSLRKEFKEKNGFDPGCLIKGPKYKFDEVVKNATVLSSYIWCSQLPKRLTHMITKDQDISFEKEQNEKDVVDLLKRRKDQRMKR